MLALFAEDAQFTASGPFAEEELGPFVRRHLTADVAVDATRKQVARDGITWTVNVDGTKARAHAELRNGRITRFAVG